MNLYTAFCKNPYMDDPTTWIDCIHATTPREAIEQARKNCAHDWDCKPLDIDVIGIIEGQAFITAWDDHGL